MIMDELRSKHKALHATAHQIALDCMHPQYLRFIACLCLEQSLHGSPYHVHPYPSPVRLQHAFGTQQSPKMFHPKGLKSHLDGRYTPTDSPILGRALCLTPKGSPLPGRVSHLSDKFQDSLTLMADTDALVAKISAMFPTVSETHIKILLKKYYNREAVVISALQVEKHPITTPGPLTMSPMAVRLQKGAMGVYSALQLAKGVSSTHGSSHFTPLTGSPHDSPMLLRPASGASSSYSTNKSDGQPPRHHSPKMKLNLHHLIKKWKKDHPSSKSISHILLPLRYLKSLYPKAEETQILDVLANKDNNVQKASEELQSMGFAKKEKAVPKKEEPPQPPKKLVTIIKSSEDKMLIKQKLQKKFSMIAERVVTIALESVDYNEERAEQILNTVLQEGDSPKIKIEVIESRRQFQAEVKKGCTSAPEPPPPQAAAATRRLKTWTEHLKPILKPSSSSEPNYKSKFATPSTGPNYTLRKGPNDDLLLKDYIPWTGPDKDIFSGQAIKPEGPESRNRGFSLARGPSGLAKGSSGLAKGSIYQKLNNKSAKIVV